VNDAELRRSIVRVTAGDATGTGFAVAPGLVLTCQHVVAGAGTRTVWVGSAPTSCDRT
jgi:hypothetical protein